MGCFFAFHNPWFQNIFKIQLLLFQMAELNLNFLRFTALTILCFFIAGLQAQSERTLAFGLGLNRYGIAASFKYYKPWKQEHKILAGDLGFEIGNIQHPREVALINTTLQSSGIYKFGKINYAWAFRPTYVFRYPLSLRQDRKSIALNAVAGIGIPVAYSWPVYIRLYQQGSGASEQYTEVRYDPNIHPQNLIGGRAPFRKGIREGSFTPGVGLHSALEFSWGNYRTDVKIVTLGMRVEAYSKKLPILYINSMNKQLFSMFYLTFALGFGKN